MPERGLLLAALVAYTGSVVWSFVVWPLRAMDGLYFYYYEGLQATVQLFAPLVLLLACVVTRGRLRAATVLVTGLALLWLLFPGQSPYLYANNQGGHTLHVISLLLCAVTGLTLAKPWRWTSLPTVHWNTALIRRVGAIVLAAAAVMVLFGMAPEHTTSPSMISAALSDDQLNQSNAQGAPQQAVVNGWTARDLLTIIARQGEEARDDRPTVFAFLALLGVLLFVGTSSRGAPTTRGRLAETRPGAALPTAQQMSYGSYPLTPAYAGSSEPGSAADLSAQ
jgi:hypothetical protein